MIVEMVELDFKIVVNNFWYFFFYFKWICIVLLSLCVVYFCVYMCVYVYICLRYLLEINDVCFIV